jgi:uncharacterized protein (TIGR00255 family)
MLLSMTGFGQSRTPDLRVELRSVNNRHLKVTVRGSEPYPLLEAELEKVLKRTIKRGTITVFIRAERAVADGGGSLNIPLLKHYTAQIRDAFPDPAERAALLASVVALPGVTDEAAVTDVPPGEWDAVEALLNAAAVKLNASRAAEGRAMAAELLSHKATITTALAAIHAHLPGIVASFRQRLFDRVNQALADAKAVLDPAHVVREVAIYADRTDVSEELTRLAAHLDTFEEIIRTGGDSPGRRLEFVAQEMGREANTLGSKAGDVTVSRHVVDIKATLEKIRELVLNIE